METTTPPTESSTSQPGTLGRMRAFGQKYKGEIGIAALVLYVFLLALGTVGEIWDVEWILDLPLFRPPGKY